MNEESKINVTLPESAKELIIREGAALPAKEPVKVVIIGTIDAPALFAAHHKPNVEFAHVVVNRDNMEIKLYCDENNCYGSEITGKLSLSTELAEFGINTSKTYTPDQLGDFFKMRRFAFEKVEDAMKIISELKNFEAKVETVLKEKNDNRGNTTSLKQQIVDSNIPASFRLKLPVFKGTEKQSIEVEINITTRYECSLISPALAEGIAAVRDELINKPVIELKESGYLVIEQ